MKQCFVIQPFDNGGIWDQRFEGTFAPAIKKAGFEPYRVDRDPAVIIPIQEIEKGIAEADLCFAEITTNNPNIWYELGYAFAMGKDVVMVCSSDRKEKYPFDVQHKKITPYKTDSKQDFESLERQLTERIIAISQKNDRLDDIAVKNPVKATEGLNPHEFAALVIIFEQSTLNGSISPHSVCNDMERAGFTSTAASIALRTLEKKGLVKVSLEHDFNGNEWRVFSATDEGNDWVINNQESITLHNSTSTRSQRKVPTAPEDDLPF